MYHKKGIQDLAEITIAELQKNMKNKQISSKEIVQWYLQRIDAYDKQGPMINSIININEEAIKIAQALDQERIKDGPRSNLHGIPIILKDNYDTNDMPTTAGSVLLRNSIPKQDAFTTEQLRAAGMIIMAKSNLHEFSFGISTNSSYGGQTLNPYNLTRHPGGSSGGTAAAIAANFATIGMGTDTGNSIRLPASHNNLVGLRPSEGLISRSGIVPISTTQDTSGPLGRTVSDVAMVLDVLAGKYDPRDVLTKYGMGKRPKSYLDALKHNSLNHAKIGVFREIFGQSKEAQKTNKVINQAIKQMEELGADIADITIPNFSKINAYTVIWEFETTLNKYLQTRSNDKDITSLHDIVQSGQYVKEVDRHFKNALTKSMNDQAYKSAIKNRKKLRQAIMQTMHEQNLDVILYPTVKSPAPLIGTERWEDNNGNLSAESGLPAITVPAGFTEDGLPVGVELLGGGFKEPKLLSIAYSFEQATKHRKPPVLS